MQRLRNAIRPYAWGSRTAIAELQGRPAPSPDPEAELWIGAHPSDPSRLEGDGTPLTDVIAAAPEAMLGAAVVERFGRRLPFLLKLLAAARPLSLQAHPDAAQAAEGFAAEEAAGVPRDAPHRRYVDPHHKPELLVAVTDFRALCGFREPAASAAALAGLEVPELAPIVARLREGRLAEAVRGLLQWPTPERATLVDKVVAAGAGAPEYALLGELAEAYPGDVGVLVALLLNQVTLAPGEAIFMPAGNLHAYLAGLGVEIMAASDNVLRGGLTPKHVDVSELLRVLRFEPLSDPVRQPVAVSPGVVTWPVPVPEFTLYRVRPTGAPVELSPAGPRVVLCLSGELRVADGVSDITLRGGEAGFGPPVGSLTLTGVGEAYVAATSA